ncbi:MAG: hypothetical protein HY718_14015 [Planctomycetes bacterium]|nr:hypothetical protein [Planctomycetota bacterium]
MVSVPLVASLLLVIIGWWPTQARGGPPAIEAMLLAQAVLLGVVYATVLPALRRMLSAGPTERLKLALRAAAQRFVLTLAAAGGAAAAGWVDRQAFLVWIGIGYVVLILAETAALVRWMRCSETKPCS